MNKQVKNTMEKRILNYRVIIETDEYPNGQRAYSASCPTLGVFDYGDTIEEVLGSIKNGIESMVSFLAKEGEEISTDKIEESLITVTSIAVPRNAQLATI